jgi:hypothetical protein
MHSFFSGCLTRIFVDDQQVLAAGQLQSVTARIHAALPGIPDADRVYIASALVSEVVARLAAERSHPVRQTE